MKKLISDAEKILKKMIRKGEITVPSPKESEIINKIFDDVEKDMEEYKMIDNYRAGMSRIEIEKTPTLHDYFLKITPKITDYPENFKKTFTP